MRLVIYKNKMSMVVLCMAILSFVFISAKQELNERHKKMSAPILYKEAEKLKNIGLAVNSQDDNFQVVEERNSLIVSCSSKESKLDIQRKLAGKLCQDGWQKLNDVTYKKGDTMLKIKILNDETVQQTRKNNRLYIRLSTVDAY